MFLNRRNYYRKNVVCRVDYADAKGHASMGLIKDISFGGMFVEYTPHLAVGELVTTTFTLPGSPPFKFKAKVTHATPEGVGLRFVGLSEGRGGAYPESLEAYCAILFRAWMGDF